MRSDIDKRFTVTPDNALEYANMIGEWIKLRLKEAGADGVVLGLSGGVDSALVSAICDRAKIKVHGMSLPYGNDMKNHGTMTRVEDLLTAFPAIKFGGSHDIEPACVEIMKCPVPSNALDAMFNGLLTKPQDKLAAMNVRPRVRMTTLYMIAQCMNYLVIGTDNLSENVVGYFTKWGDGANDMQPISMLTKQEVYIMARALNVPKSIINAVPSADLFEGQTDEGELGFTYDQIYGWIMNETSGDSSVDEKIDRKFVTTRHKCRPVDVFNGKVELDAA